MPGVSKAEPSSSEPRDSGPQRIVSINLCTDELLLRLVTPDRVAGMTKFSDDPEVSTVAKLSQGVRKIPGNIESVLACEPDLVLGGRFNGKETLHFFRYSDIPVLIFDVAKSFEDIYGDIRRLADAVGERQKGERIIREMQEDLAELNPGTTHGVGPFQHPVLEGLNRAVFFQSDNYVPGEGTFENAVMEAAGFRNIAAELGIRDYGRIDLERLIDARPDVIIYSSEQRNSKTVRGEVLGHPAIKKALPDVRIVTIPTLYLSCGSPVSVEAVRILAKAARASPLGVGSSDSLREDS
ncbi:MAG: corrinoid ABC transporter substrate-binding protein [Candidatus Omnitrophica bacterium ADurb.Bin277]|nr:MAG: corrinoid ABC transporter substrate-binding protein [Candidatus Omnitrophica bacterium ADurb.Bin277]